MAALAQLVEVGARHLQLGGELIGGGALPVARDDVALARVGDLR